MDAKLPDHDDWRNVVELVGKLDEALTSRNQEAAKLAAEGLEEAANARVRAAIDAGGVEPPPDFDRDQANILIARLESETPE
jgi:hypothetical protein